MRPAFTPTRLRWAVGSRSTTESSRSKGSTCARTSRRTRFVPISTQRLISETRSSVCTSRLPRKTNRRSVNGDPCLMLDCLVITRCLLLKDWHHPLRLGTQVGKRHHAHRVSPTMRGIYRTVLGQDRAPELPAGPLTERGIPSIPTSSPQSYPNAYPLR